MSSEFRSDGEGQAGASPPDNQKETDASHDIDQRFALGTCPLRADRFPSGIRSWAADCRRSRGITLPVTTICFPILIFVFVVSFQRASLQWRSYPRISNLNSSFTNPFFDCDEVGFANTKIPQYHTGSINAATSCKSKHQQQCFRRNKTTPPAGFLNAASDYEHFHKRCTHGHNLTELILEGGTAEDCKYLIWLSKDGLGNQIVSLTSAYIYALLTRRVLLLSNGSNVQSLFCEPFLHSSWLAPEGFPLEVVRHKSRRVGMYFREVLKLKSKNSTLLSALDYNQSIPGAPKYLHVKITCCDIADHQFFCPTAQRLLANTPWLFFYSHEYSVPGFYFIPQFRKTLNQWFPEKLVFRHTARYLFNPQNRLWKRIRHLYESNFREADSLLGIQVRAWRSQYHSIVSEQILQCAIQKDLLPPPLVIKDTELEQATDQARSNTSLDSTTHQRVSLAVLLASLRPEYYQNLSKTYENYRDPKGFPVSIFTASQERVQKTGDLGHDEKALIDLWLLSFMEDLIITPASTFGTVPSGLAGIVPLLLNRYGQGTEKLPESVCGRSNLEGPCFIRHPENLTCDLDSPASSIRDAGEMLPDIKHCLLNDGIGIYQG